MHRKSQNLCPCKELDVFNLNLEILPPVFGKASVPKRFLKGLGHGGPSTENVNDTLFERTVDHLSFCSK